MNRINRRRFVAVTSVAATSAVLVACGNEPLDETALNPTQIPDVPGAPPTLAPITGADSADASPEAAPADGNGGEATTSEALVITMHDDFSFSPNNPEVSPGQTITVTNEGFMQHDLVSADLGIETALLNAGESEDIVIPEDATVGESYHFICTVAGHEQSGMVGDFLIVEAGAAAPAAEEEAPAEEEATADEEAPAEEGAAAPAEALTITMHDDFSFNPNNPEVSPGQTITVVNEGFMQHDLVSDDLGIATALLNAGESEDIVIPEDATVGESYYFKCTVAGHEQSGMFGDFLIVEASAAAAPAAAEEEAPAEEEATAEEEAPAEEGAAAPAEALTITMHDDFSFNPNNPEVSPGQTITVVNEGFMQHDLVSDDLGIGTALLNAGESEDIVIPEDATVGEQYHFICTVAGHDQSGMNGDFIIVEGSAAAAAPAGEEEAPAEAEATAEEAEAEVADPSADNTPEASTIVGTLWEFTPSEFEMAPGGVVTFQNNTGMMMGVDSGEGESLLSSIADGATGEFTIPEDAEVGSTFEIQSNLSEAVNLGMVGTITIVEGEGAAATPVASPAATPEDEESDDDADAGAAGDAVVIDALDSFAFEPDVVEVTPGQTVTLVNQGFMQHDLVCDDLGIGTDLLNHSESEDIVIPDDATVGETYRFICTVAGHEQSGMVGEFVIV